MSDLPPPVRPVRTALLLHALVAAAMLVVAALSGAAPAKAFLVAVVYFVLAGGWSWLKARRDTAATGDPGGPDHPGGAGIEGRER